MYSCLLISPSGAAMLREKAEKLGLMPEGWDVKCHHLTLEMGKGDYPWGETKEIEIVAYGKTEGKVTAFKAKCSDSKNKTPHITVAVGPGTKPVASNFIEEWVSLLPFTVQGEFYLAE